MMKPEPAPIICSCLLPKRRRNSRPSGVSRSSGQLGGHVVAGDCLGDGDVHHGGEHALDQRGEAVGGGAGDGALRGGGAGGHQQQGDDRERANLARTAGARLAQLAG